jgi:adenylate cyclase class IV
MNNIEQEYSFKVSDLKPFFTYLDNNKYELIETTEQVRTLYKKNDNTMLRLTIKKSNDKVVKELDFKQDNLSNNAYIERKESLPIVYEDEEAVQSIINFLDYKKAIELVRKRYVYKKNDIKFEIDEYISPEQALVVAIEGQKDTIEEIYNELKDKYNNYFINE